MSLARPLISSLSPYQLLNKNRVEDTETINDSLKLFRIWNKLVGGWQRDADKEKFIEWIFLYYSTSIRSITYNESSIQ